MLRQLNEIISFWIGALERYSVAELLVKPQDGGWSIGQLYNHLINETAFYIGEIETCLSNNEHAKEKMSDEGRKLFQKNCFPDVKLKRPEGNPEPPQPENKEKLMAEMEKLKLKLHQLGTDIENSRNNGKTRHPGLLYFNAREWLQFAEMHLRHHLRQKREIDKYLEEIKK
jgi:hypothetical protein